MHISNSLFRKLAIVGVLIIVVLISEVYASDILEGTPQTQSGTTVYTAIVEPGQTYSSVLGVRGNSTDSYSYGKVISDKGVVTGNVFGARVTSGDNYIHASYNVVDITDSNIGTVYGGYAYGGNNNAGIQCNSVKINGGNITGYVYGGYADGSTISLTNNKVVINNAQIGKSVYGGCAFNTESWLSMLRNDVVIENSSINGSVYGGYASGSYTASNNNTVTIRTNTNVKGSVYGGYALSNNSDAKNNTVIIEGGTVNGHIYGGIGRNVSNNTVVIKGGNLANADLFGYSDGRKKHNDNTLELWAANTEIKSSRNFENYYFFIPDGIVNQEDQYMLMVENPVNLSDTNVGIAVQNGTELHVGDTINLIDKTEGGVPTLVDLEGKTFKGGTLLTKYDFSLSSTEGVLVATATSGGRPLLHSSSSGNPAGKAYSEAAALTGGQLASVSLLGRDSDSCITFVNRQKVTAFLTVNYGKTEYSADSHIEMNSTDIIAGIAKDYTNPNVEKLLSLYFESGHGKYSTFNSFGSGSIFGNGNAHYYGGGLKFEAEPSRTKGLSLQALGRIGFINNSWSTDDFFKERVSYDTRQLYYGATAGIGYKSKLGNTISYDVSCKFSWIHQNGSKTNVKGENMQFQGINSQKTGMGLKITYDGLKFISPFIGVTWEKEFNSVAQSKVNNLKIDSVDLKGNSGILELGTTCKPKKESSWQLDVAANFYFGVRREISGFVFFTRNF